MGKLLLAALLGGVVSAILTSLLVTAIAPGDRRREVEERMAVAESVAAGAKEQAEAATRRLQLLQRNLESATREHARSVAAIEESLASRGAAEGAAPGAAAPDGSPYVSRAELDAALAKARATAVAAPFGEGAPVQAKSLEEIARELGLSSSEEAQVRQILREMEEEALACFFGDRPIPQIEAEVRAAKDDPDKMQALVGEAVGRMFTNIGKVVTLESRTKKRLGEAIGQDKAKQLLAQPRTPVLGADFESLFKDLDLE